MGIAKLVPVKKPKRPSWLPYTPSYLDDADLPLEAHRVFDHLARRVQPVLRGGEIRWMAQVSLNEIAEKCFRGSYPESPLASLRRKAFQSIQCLADRRMIRVEQTFRADGSQGCNSYHFLPVEEWQSAAKVQTPLARKSRRSHPRSPGDQGERSSDDQRPQIPAGSAPDPTSPIPRSPGDHIGDPFKELDPLREDPFKEREKKKADHYSSEQEPLHSAETQGAYTSPVVQPEPVAPERSSAPVSSLDFDWAAYDWDSYSGPGSGGSCPGFWDWAYTEFEGYNMRKLERGEAPIGDLKAYTMTCIRQRGAAGYRKYLVAIGAIRAAPLPKKPKRLSSQLHCSTAGDWLEPPNDLSEELITIKRRWVELRLGWNDPRWLKWVEQTQSVFPFNYTGQGFYALPDWVICKLASDLEESL